jgi:hypothetical protein
VQLTGAGRSCDHLVNEHVRDSATSTDMAYPGRLQCCERSVRTMKQLQRRPQLGSLSRCFVGDRAHDKGTDRFLRLVRLRGRVWSLEAQNARMLRDADFGAVDQDDPETCLWRAASIRPPPAAHLACAESSTVNAGLRCTHLPLGKGSIWLAPIAFFDPADSSTRSSPWPGCMASASSPDRPPDRRYRSGSRQDRSRRPDAGRGPRASVPAIRESGLWFICDLVLGTVH